MTKRVVVLFAKSLALALVFACPQARADIERVVDPIALYGGRIIFDVLRDDELVGQHLVRFRRNDGDLIVESRFDLGIEVLFIPIYRYHYQSSARWRDGTLMSLVATTDDDGEVSEVRVRRTEASLVLNGPDGEAKVPANTFPTNHWNAGVLGVREVINTITGRLNRVEITPQGREVLVTSEGQIPATHYAYSGELQNEVWYDDHGRWVKMRFKGQDGSTIEYRCSSCTGGATAESE